MKRRSVALLALSCALVTSSCLQSQNDEPSLLAAADQAQSSSAVETSPHVERAIRNDFEGDPDCRPANPTEPLSGIAPGSGLEACDGNETSTADSQALDEAQLANPAELQKCLAACKAGGSTTIAYCGTMPTPQLRAMCYAAAAAGTVSCMGFCYARFVD